MQPGILHRQARHRTPISKVKYKSKRSRPRSAAEQQSGDAAFIAAAYECRIAEQSARINDLKAQNEKLSVALQLAQENLARQQELLASITTKPLDDRYADHYDASLPFEDNRAALHELALREGEIPKEAALSFPSYDWKSKRSRSKSRSAVPQIGIPALQCD